MTTSRSRIHTESRQSNQTSARTNPHPRRLESIAARLALGLALAGWSLSTSGADPPKPTGLAPFMAKLGYARIELELDDSKDLIFRGKLDNKPTEFLIDSGCSITVVHPNRAKGLPRLDGRSFRLDDSFLGAVQGAELVALPNLELGGVTFQNQPARILDLTMFRGQAGSFSDRPSLSFRTLESRHPDVILGIDLFRRNHAVLYTRETSLYIREQAPSAKVAQVFADSLRQSGFETLPVKEAFGTMFVLPARVNGEALNFLMDTGAFATIIDQRTSRRLKLPESNLGSKMVGLRQRSSFLAETRLRQLRIGGWEAKDYVAAIADLSPWSITGQTMDGPEIHGLIGIDLMVHTFSIVDFHERRVFVKTGPATR